MEALALKGRKVKNRVVLLSSRIYDPIFHKDERRDIPANTVGFLANAIGDEILIAYPNTRGVLSPSLEAMMRSNAFFIINVNWPTFRMQFDIE
jgi:hypothetical protein